MAYGTGFGGAFGASRRPPPAAQPQMAPPMQSAPPPQAPQQPPPGRALPRPTRRPAPPPPRNMQPGRGLPRPIASQPPAEQFDPNNPGSWGPVQNGLGETNPGGTGPGSWIPGSAMQEQANFNQQREWQIRGPQPMQGDPRTYWVPGQGQGGSDSQQFRDAMQARNSKDWGPNEFQVQGGPSSQFRGPSTGLQGAPSRNFNQQFPQGRGGDDMVSTMPVRPKQPAAKPPRNKKMPGIVGAPPRRSGSVY